MTISTTQTNEKPICIKKSTPVKKVRGKDAVPFEEMERLMNLYGSMKALRNRGAPKKKGGAAAAGGNDKKVPVKKDSIKRKFYRWFPNFEERFTKDENGQYQPIHGHEYEMKYRQEMRNKSVEDVTAKRSYAITRRNYEKKNNICQMDSKMGHVSSSEVSNSSDSNSSDIKVPDDIEINTSNIAVPSPTTTQSENNKDSFFFNSGNRAPSPLSFLQEPANRVVSEDEEDTILSLVSQTGEEIAASSGLKNLNLSLFDEVDKHLMSMMNSYEPMPMMQSNGAMPMMNSHDPMPMMNAYDPMQMNSTMPSMLNSYPAMPMNTSYEPMPMNSEYSRYSDDSIQGSMGMASNSSNSSDDSSLYLDEHWGTDRDIEDCLLLGMGNEIVPTMTSLR